MYMAATPGGTSIPKARIAPQVKAVMVAMFAARPAICAKDQARGTVRHGSNDA
jgi:hypothetical protein